MEKEQFNQNFCLRSETSIVWPQTYLQLDEVELGGAGVHQRVEVLVAGELRLDESADVGLRHTTAVKTV